MQSIACHDGYLELEITNGEGGLVGRFKGVDSLDRDLPFKDAIAAGGKDKREIAIEVEAWIDSWDDVARIRRK